ncbi:MAG: hypothetical protein DHS20C16_20860 [Phycisphaerae bacterium]|nr:MAG: hypothetical protein DHS20C16_20860 [Phycisphaerae bacterium]
MSGLPGIERLWAPALWFEQLPSELLSAQMTCRRTQVATGTRARGVWLALTWNLGGFFLSALLPGSGVATIEGLLTLALWFTLWSFIGLLILPTPSRRGVYAADAQTLRNGVDECNLRKTIETLDRWQDNESERPNGVEAIFHPVPSVANRLARLKAPSSTLGAYHAARMALPTSWVCLGFLGRAVHCNCGRRELWVMLPGD